MKAVMLSIRPKWCELIANRKKTVEVRKSRPKLETPFKCYIYCTKASAKHFFVEWSCLTSRPRQSDMCKVIGEFICDKIDSFDSDFDEWANSCAPAGSSIESMGWNKFLNIIHGDACISDEELNRYFPENVNAYLWHISGLKIYDEPKDLCEFSRFGFYGMGRSKVVCGNSLCDNYIRSYSYDEPPECSIDGCQLQRPPQSWCYIDNLNEQVVPAYGEYRRDGVADAALTQAVAAIGLPVEQMESEL